MEGCNPEQRMRNKQIVLHSIPLTESYTLSDANGMMSSESAGSGTLSGQLSGAEMEPLQINTDVRLMLAERPGSGTEGSSFGSNCSSHALLNAGETIEDGEQKMTI